MSASKVGIATLAAITWSRLPPKEATHELPNNAVPFVVGSLSSYLPTVLVACRANGWLTAGQIAPWDPVYQTVPAYVNGRQT